jgi:ElaB/YqjD/DUF883 family membrane-anchored ribosome-binding protein
MAFRKEVAEFCDQVIDAGGKVHGKTLQAIRRKIEHFHAMNIFNDADTAAQLSELKSQIFGLTGETLKEQPDLADEAEPGLHAAQAGSAGSEQRVVTDRAIEAAGGVGLMYTSWAYSTKTHDSIIFMRGHFSIKQLPQTRDLPWEEVPITMTFKFAHSAIDTIITISLDAPNDMQFDKDNAALFHENAEQDCTAILDAVNYILTQDDADSEHQYDPEAGYQSFHNSATNESHSDYRDAHDNNNQSTSDSVNNTYTYISDYEELGLDATASWDDVGADYPMSHYVECTPGFKDREALIEALVAVGFDPAD